MERVEKKWSLNPQPEKQQVVNLQNAINASAPLASLLLQRGKKDFEAARTFFNPSISQLHHPFLMKDMQLAVERISKAIESGENIMVYGDYDVDGTTSVALLYSFLTNHTERVSYYIPDRYKEGYGVSMESIDFAADNDISLIIALDCGIKAVDQVAKAKTLSIDFIICDHHIPGNEIPDAHAILNPLQKGCDYPYKSLSGCGIGFKLTQALAETWELDRTDPLAHLDLVAIAAACDIVPMTGENRVLCYLGLELLQEAQRPGIAQLLENAGRLKDGLLRRPLTVSDLVFAIGPRINAAGRMDHGQKAVELLCATTSKASEEAAAAIIQNNIDRRETDLKILDEALLKIDFDAEKTSNVLFQPDWHKGVVGIVASRVQDFSYRPTVVLTESNGFITGSARSVQGFDIHEAISSCHHLLETFGGHPAAAGLTLHKDNLEEFKTAFEKAVRERISPDQLVPVLEIDMELELSEITDLFFTSMNRMAPFGPQNMRPVFVSYNVKNAQWSKAVGENNEHLKLHVYQGTNKSITIKGIAFGLGHYAERIKNGEEFSLVYTLELNEFNGVKTIEMMVKDIRFNGS
ncbi:MAG: single-stranded-DNA-specific exonuclease RecJ [Salibacteraceae bacterium]